MESIVSIAMVCEFNNKYTICIKYVQIKFIIYLAYYLYSVRVVIRNHNSYIFIYFIYLFVYSQKMLYFPHLSELLLFSAVINLCKI